MHIRLQQVNCLEFSRDKQFLAAASNPSAKVYDVPSLSSSTTHHDPLYKLEGHTGNITSIGFQRDNKWVFTGSEDGTLRVWDMRASSQKCQRTYETPGAVNSVVLHPNQGELIAGDNAGIVTVWDLAADKCVNELPPADGGTAISSVSIAQDSSIFVSATYAGNCFFWDSRGASDSWTPIRQLQAHKTYILKCRLSPDAQYLATCSSDKTCKLWKISNFSLFNTFTGHSRWVWDCRFSADSNYLVTGEFFFIVCLLTYV